MYPAVLSSVYGPLASFNIFQVFQCPFAHLTNSHDHWSKTNKQKNKNIEVAVKAS